MPTYTFRNIKTEEVFDVFMRMSEREQYLKDNPHLVQTVTVAPAAGNRFIEMGTMAKNTPADYKGLLKRIKKNNPGSKMRDL